MVVNALVTGLIVFKILKVFLEVSKATSNSGELTLELLSSTGGPKLRHIIFIIIESGMALFAIQLARVVMTLLAEVHWQDGSMPPSFSIAMSFVIIIHQTLNVIIRSLHFLLILFY